jgi:hypothetical protein
MEKTMRSILRRLAARRARQTRNTEIRTTKNRLSGTTPALAGLALAALTPLPVHAQSLPLGTWSDPTASWSICDANGVPYPDLSTTGRWDASDQLWTLMGIPSGDTQNSYPNLAWGSISLDGYPYAPNLGSAQFGLGYLYGIDISPVATLSLDNLANNCLPNSAGGWYGSVTPPPGHQFYTIVGSVASSASATLTGFWLWNPCYSGFDAQSQRFAIYPNDSPANIIPSGDTKDSLLAWTTVPSPPDHVDFLLNTAVISDGTIGSLDGPDGKTGRITFGTAFDLVFNEISQDYLDDSAWSAANPTLENDGPYIHGHHLVRAAVAGNIAEVYLDGFVQGGAGNPVLYDEVPGDPASGNPSTAESVSTVSANAKMDDRDVTISSPPIEPSKYIHEPSLLPVITHIRNADGSMDADSVLTPDDQIGPDGKPLNNYWYAGGIGPGAGYQFVANTPNFTNPTYLWSVPDTDGGTLTTLTQGYLNSGDGNNGIVVQIRYPMGESDMNQTKHATIRVDVTDGPGTDGATMANVYNVTWHTPVEWFNPPYDIEQAPNRYCKEPAHNSNGQTTMKPEDQAYFTIDAGEADWEYDGLSNAIWLGAGAAVWPYYAVEVGLEGPAGWGVAALLAAASFAEGADVPPPPLPGPNFTIDYGKYAAAVDHQVLVDANPSAYPNNDTTFEPANYLAAANQQIQNIKNEWGGTWKEHAGEDPFFSQTNGAMTVTGKSGYSRQKESRHGANYGATGYTGPADGAVTKDKDPFYELVFHWAPY